MNKKVGLAFLGILLVGFIFVSAEWSSVGIEFEMLGDLEENVFKEDSTIRMNYLSLIYVVLSIFIVALVLYLVLKKRKVNKGKISKKRKVKKK